MIEWYNILQENQLLDFAEDKNEEDSEVAKDENTSLTE
jgi:hypothetical protein